MRHFMKQHVVQQCIYIHLVDKPGNLLLSNPGIRCDIHQSWPLRKRGILLSFDKLSEPWAELNNCWWQLLGIAVSVALKDRGICEMLSLFIVFGSAFVVIILRPSISFGPCDILIGKRVLRG